MCVNVRAKDTSVGHGFGNVYLTQSFFDSYTSLMFLTVAFLTVTHLLFENYDVSMAY